VIIEPVVGDFYEHFSNQGFFDSLVRLFLTYWAIDDWKKDGYTTGN
jgi:hypothetical protein